jgi:hypothetical protein
MKHKTLLMGLAAALAIGLVSCSKNETVTTTADDANKAAEAAKAEAAKSAEAARVEAAKAEAEKTAEAAKVEAAKVEAAKVEAAKVEAARVEAARVEAARVEAAKAAEAAKSADNSKFQGLIDKAKSLIAENKLSDASSVLQQLAGQSLSGEQQKVVDGLKAQIQKALIAKAAGDAAGSAGNLLR